MFKRITGFIIALMLIPAAAYAELSASVEEDFVLFYGNVGRAFEYTSILVENSDGKAVYISQALSDAEANAEFKADKRNFAESGLYTYKVWLAGAQRSESGQLAILDGNISDEEKAMWDAQKTDIVYDGVSDKLTLPDKCSGSVFYGSEISWSVSGDGAEISDSTLKINRAVCSGTIELTGVFSYGGATYTRLYSLSVRQITDKERAEYDIANVTVSYDGGLKAELETMGAYGSTFYWESDSELVKISGGSMEILKESVTEQTSVKLKCTAKYNDFSAEREFEIIILPMSDSDREKVDIDLLKIEYDGSSDSFNIQAYGEKYKTEFVWTSSNKSVIEVFKTKASVYRSGLKANAEVTLTAKTKSGIEKSFTVTVKKGASQSGSGGGGGGGSSRGSSGSSSAAKTAPAVSVLPEVKKGFTDLDGYDWAREAVEAMSDRGIISGRESGIFAPSEKVTRAEMAAMLLRVLGISEKNAEDNSFSDVTADAWYAGAVGAAKREGIILGDGSGAFNPGGEVTREDLCVMICRAFKIDADGKAEFADSDEICEYARKSVYALCEKGAVSGRENNIFDPHAACTRAEAAKIIYGCL